MRNLILKWIFVLIFLFLGLFSTFAFTLVVGELVIKGYFTFMYGNDFSYTADRFIYIVKGCAVVGGIGAIGIWLMYVFKLQR